MERTNSIVYIGQQLHPRQLVTFKFSAILYIVKQVDSTISTMEHEMVEPGVSRTSPFVSLALSILDLVLPAPAERQN